MSLVRPDEAPTPEPPGRPRPPVPGSGDEMHVIPGFRGRGGGRGAHSRLPNADGVTAVTVVMLLLYLIPARLTFAPLGAAGRPAGLFGIALLAWWMLSRLVPSLTRRGRQPMRLALLGYLYVYVITFVMGMDRGLPGIEQSSSERAVLTTLGLVGTALIACDGVPDRLRLDTLLRRLVFLGSIVAFLGVLQFLFGIDLVGLIQIPGLSLNDELIGIAERGDAGLRRVASTAAHYIEYGVVMAMVMPIALHFALYAKERAERQKRWAQLALIGVSVPFSISRSAFVALAIILIVLVPLWNLRFQAQAVIVGIASLAFLRAAVPGLIGTITALFANAGNDPSVQNRRSDYPIVFRYVAQRPIFGRGPGTFIPDRYILLDNELLGTLVSTGYLGLAAFIMLFVVAVVMCRSIAKHSRHPETRHLAQCLLGSALAGLVASATFDSLSFATFALTLFVIFGCIGALWRTDRDPAARIDDRHGEQILKPNRLRRSRAGASNGHNVSSA